MGKHAAHHSSTPAQWSVWRISLLLFLIAWALMSVIGTIMLWPGQQKPNVSADFYHSFPLAHSQISGTVIQQDPGACSAPEHGQIFHTLPRISPESTQRCTWSIVDITEGDYAGWRTLLINSGEAGEPILEVGSHIRLIESYDTNGKPTYAFGDMDRWKTLTLWGLIFAVGIISLALMRGVRALIGLGITMLVVGYFTLPALLLGSHPLTIAVISGALILLTVVIFVHGFNWKSASALGGTLSALALSAFIATIAIDHNHIRGLGEEGNLYILLYLPDVNITGLMLCGFSIGCLGVLNDVAIAQASTVKELADLNPEATSWQLFRSALQVGRDHISSMVYTLVLTYTGASLPMMLLLSVAHQPLGQFLTSDIMASEILRSGIGALALTLAVPLTTLCAAFTVSPSTLSARGAHTMNTTVHSH